ncbi:MAG: flagellar hook-length control protein FliK [Bacillota bacterium]
MDLNGLAPIRKLDIGMLRQALNTDNLSSDEKQAKSQSTELLPEIFRLLASLEDDTQKMLLDSWAKMEMPLNEKTVSNLISYLENNPALTAEDKMAVIKAFAFLESNGLPFSEKMVDALRSIFNNNGNLSSTLDNFMSSENSLNQEQLNNLLANLNLSELKDSLINIDNFSQHTQENVNQEAAASTANLNSNNLNSENLNEQPVQNIAQAGEENQSLNQNFKLNEQILNKFNNLDQETKNIILNNLDSLGKNFDQNTIKILNNFLANNNIEQGSQKTALLKAFAFLENNQLPLTENLIKEIAAKFEQNVNQVVANLNNKEEILTNLNKSEQALLSQNESNINLAAETSQIAERLSLQAKISDQVLALFNQIEGQSEEKIADNLLGQKLINLQQQNQATPLMLALEIPVQLPNKKLSSLLLKIEAEKEKSETKNNKNKGYNISFILEFEKIGPIQTNVEINKNKINTTFFTESSETAELIKNNFSKLQSVLQTKGFNIQNVKIKNFDNLAEKKQDFFNDLILPKLNNLDENGKYRHIDIKI